MIELNDIDMQDVASIEAALRQAAQAYEDGNPVMSDADYDALRDQLTKLDPDNPFLSEVGAPVCESPLTKVPHPTGTYHAWMGSLNKCGGDTRGHDYETWRRGVANVAHCDDFVVGLQWKLDGVSIDLVYRGGKLVQAITRGDGTIGEDVTHTMKQVAPAKLTGRPPKGTINIRAEAIMPIPVWERFFGPDSGNTETHANPRNTVAGLVRRKSDTNESRHIRLVAYDILSQELTWRCCNETTKVALLQEWGFNVVETVWCEARQVPEQAAKFEARRDSLDFEADGAVVKVIAPELQELLGEHDNRPKWAVAWKFEARGGFSILRAVEWATGTTGRITPVAVVDPVKVSGVTITRISLHNPSLINSLGLHIGDQLEIVRAGDVIPKVVRVVTNNGGVIPTITECPDCGGKVGRNGRFYVCLNAECRGVGFRRLKSWITKRNIMHLGVQYIRILYNAGVRTVPALYRLDENGLVKAGIPAGMAGKIAAEIEKSRTTSLADFLGSLSIDMLGRSEAANLIALGFTTLESFCAMRVEDLLKHPRYGEIKAGRIVQGIQDALPLIRELATVLKIKVSGGSLAGKSFCFTGAAKRPRKELEAMVERAGGTVKGSVGRGLTYLVMADPNSTSTKAEKARQLGVELISEEAFVAMAG